MALIFLYKWCKFGEKICNNSRDIEFFLGDYFFIGAPCIVRCWTGVLTSQITYRPTNERGSNIAVLLRFLWSSFQLLKKKQWILILKFEFILRFVRVCEVETMHKIRIFDLRSPYFHNITEVPWRSTQARNHEAGNPRVVNVIDIFSRWRHARSPRKSNLTRRNCFICHEFRNTVILPCVLTSLATGIICVQF